MKVRFVAAVLLTVGIGSAPVFAGTSSEALVGTAATGPACPQGKSAPTESFKPVDERARQRTEQMLQRFADQAYQN